MSELTVTTLTNQDIFIPKVMLKYDQVTDTIIASEGVSSVLDESTGQFKVNFTVPFANGDYYQSFTGSAYRTRITNITVPSTTVSDRFESFSSGGANTNFSKNIVVIHGEK